MRMYVDSETFSPFCRVADEIPFAMNAVRWKLAGRLECFFVIGAYRFSHKAFEGKQKASNEL